MHGTAAFLELPCSAPASLSLPPRPQNFFLYFFGMCFNLVGLAVFMLAGALSPATMFAGFRTVSGRMQQPPVLYCAAKREHGESA